MVLVQKQQDNIKECIQTLQTAMTISVLKPKRGCRVWTAAGLPELSVPDNASLYLELVEDQMHEADKIMQDAIEEFHGTTEEGRVTIANASLSLYKGDTKLALKLAEWALARVRAGVDSLSEQRRSEDQRPERELVIRLSG